MLNVAILDDYANVALSATDWSAITGRATVQAFSEHLGDEAITAALQPFDIICTLRERTFLSRQILSRLPNLQAVIAAGPNAFTIDYDAAQELGIEVIQAEAPAHLDVAIDSTTELVWGLILSTVRHIPQQVASLRQGHWRHRPGMSLAGRTLGILGLGRFGVRVARIAQVLNMQVIAWSENLTDDAAAAAGVRRVGKDTLFSESDIVSIHYALSERSRGIVGAREIGLMKPAAYLVNTSRGALVDEAALIIALQEKRIAGAGLDVFEREPLQGDHPLLKLDNVVATPHIGFITEPAMEYFYTAIADTLAAYLDTRT